MKKVKLLIFVFCLLTFSIYGVEKIISEQNQNHQHDEAAPKKGNSTIEEGENVSSNPAASNKLTGTGAIGEWLGFKKESGIRLGALWIGDINYLIAGGLDPHKSSGNNLFQLSLNIDLETRLGWKGGAFGIEFLQFNGRPTNDQAGSVPGYNGLVEIPPFDRSELYQYWIRQDFFNKKLVIRIGKSLPSYDFNNVVNPVHLQEKSLSVPAVSGLIYTPIFINPTLLGVLPGYYNSAFGINISINPENWCYLSYGVYDGNLARMKNTGIRGPQFNGYYFHIAENGYSWKFGKSNMPGKFAYGVWYQSGKLTAAKNIEQKGSGGIYFFASQRLWKRHPNRDNSGIIGFVQAGINRAKTLQVNKFFGMGLTFLGLVPLRLDDSFGFGLALSKLNSHLFARKNELLLQTYYQAFINESAFFEAALSYIPKPGAAPHLKSAWAGTARIIALF